jgi:hypothetical protein
MVVSDYRTQLNKVKTAMMISKLMEETKGRFNENELKAIAQRQWYENDNVLIPIVDLDIEIVVCETVEEFAEKVTLERSGVEHSWAGEDTFTQYGDWIVGSDSSFGKNKNLVYSNNGTEQAPDTEYIEPHFNMEENQAALVKSESRYTFSDRRDYEERWSLYILVKGGELQINDKIKKIMEEFNI